MSTREKVPPLRTVSPCEHGIKHDIAELQEGSEFYTRECLYANGKEMRAHIVDARYPLAPVRKEDGRFIPPWLRESA